MAFLKNGEFNMVLLTFFILISIGFTFFLFASYSILSPFIVLLLLCSALFVVSIIFYGKYKNEQEKNKQMSNKIYGLLHDLKVPLTSVLGYIELIELQEISEQTRFKFLQIIKFEAVKFLQTINNFSDEKTKINSNKVTDCKEIISSVCRSLALEANKKNIKISYNCDSFIFISFDKIQFWRVISNLLENAIKYNKEDGSIFISVSSDDKNVVITFEDTGIGIKPENIMKVFNKGFRENDNLEVEGSGLGLHNVYQTITSNGSQIKLESKEGYGTRFTLKLNKAVTEEPNEKFKN